MKQKVLFGVGSVILTLGFVLLFFGKSVYAAEGTVNYYHKHTGSSQSGGGCYGKQCSGTQECGSYNLHSWENANGTYNYRCGQCGNEWTYAGYLSGAKCQRQVNYHYYECNCGVGSGAVASLSYSYPQNGWVKAVDISARYELLHESCRVSEEAYVWNGAPSSNSSYHVTQNGTYTLGLSADENTDTSQVLSITIDCIDANAPVIEAFYMPTEGYCREAVLTVSATDTESGLAEQPYSYDGGVSWTNRESLVVTQNGTYTVWVRDRVGNQSSATAEVACIDRTEPTVVVTTSPNTDAWYEGELLITLQATDAESGLANCPYSYDNGVSFGTESSYCIAGSTELKIVVADKAGNHKSVIVNIHKKVRPTQPTKEVKPTAGASANTSATAATCVPTVTGVPEVTTLPEVTEAVVPDLQEGTDSSVPGGNSGTDGEVPETKSGENRRERRNEKTGKEDEPEDDNPAAEVKEQHYPGLHYPEVHYPEETWQGTPMTKQETVVLNELLEQPEEREMHTVMQTQGQAIDMASVRGAIFLGITILCAGVVLFGKYIVFVKAKDKNGKYRPVGVTRVCGKRPALKVNISDAMLKKADTNYFLLRMPWWYKAFGPEDKVVVSCHRVEREIPLQKSLYIRLRSE